MFQFHQINPQLLFHIIVSLLGAGAFSRDFTTKLAPQCRAFSPRGAGDTNDWCIIRLVLGHVFHIRVTNVYLDLTKANRPQGRA